jgi:hypothetical protein
MNGRHQSRNISHFRGEHARAPERLVIQEVADLVDDGHLRVLAETADVEAQRLAGAVIPLISADLDHGPGTNDRQERKATVAVDGVDGRERSPHGIECGTEWDDHAAADGNSARGSRSVALLHGRSGWTEGQDGLGVAGDLRVRWREPREER